MTSSLSYFDTQKCPRGAAGSTEVVFNDDVPDLSLRAATAGDVLALIRSGRARTQAEVGRVTGLSRTAVAARVAALRRIGLVTEGEVGPSEGGRPPVRLVLDRHAGVVLAAAIGRSRTQLAVCDLEGAVLTDSEVVQEVGAGPGPVLAAAIAGFRALLAQAGVAPGAVRGVGCSVPAVVDAGRRVMTHSKVLAAWEGVEPAAYFRELTDSPVVVDNDAAVLALSERHGVLKEYDDALVVKVSTGLGLGIVSGGRLVRGGRGAAGELGHVKTPAAEGRPCRCGETGCLEAIAGGWALVQELRERGGPQVADRVGHVRDLVMLALEGDAVARRLVRDSGRRLGEVLATAVDLLNPSAVVVGGDLAAAYDVLVAGLRESVYARSSALATEQLVILPATHGQQAGVVGCASVVLDEILSPDAVDRSLAPADQAP